MFHSFPSIYYNMLVLFVMFRSIRLYPSYMLVLFVMFHSFPSIYYNMLVLFVMFRSFHPILLLFYVCSFHHDVPFSLPFILLICFCCCCDVHFLPSILYYPMVVLFVMIPFFSSFVYMY